MRFRVEFNSLCFSWIPMKIARPFGWDLWFAWFEVQYRNERKRRLQRDVDVVYSGDAGYY